jgi:hypothetical protein
MRTHSHTHAHTCPRAPFHTHTHTHTHAGSHAAAFGGFSFDTTAQISPFHADHVGPDGVGHGATLSSSSSSAAAAAAAAAAAGGGGGGNASSGGLGSGGGGSSSRRTRTSLPTVMDDEGMLSPAGLPRIHSSGSAGSSGGSLSMSGSGGRHQQRKPPSLTVEELPDPDASHVRMLDPLHTGTSAALSVRFAHGTGGGKLNNTSAIPNSSSNSSSSSSAAAAAAHYVARRPGSVTRGKAAAAAAVGLEMGHVALPMALSTRSAESSPTAGMGLGLGLGFRDDLLSSHAHGGGTLGSLLPGGAMQLSTVKEKDGLLGRFVMPQLFHFDGLDESGAGVGGGGSGGAGSPTHHLHGGLSRHHPASSPNPHPSPSPLFGLATPAGASHASSHHHHHHHSLLQPPPSLSHYLPTPTTRVSPRVSPRSISPHYRLPSPRYHLPLATPAHLAPAHHPINVHFAMHPPTIPPTPSGLFPSSPPPISGLSVSRAVDCCARAVSGIYFPVMTFSSTPCPSLSV